MLIPGTTFAAYRWNVDCWETSITIFYFFAAFDVPLCR